MTGEQQGTTNQLGVPEILSSEVYKENLDFWNRAWGPVKTAYTQMPTGMPYLDLVPELLKKCGANTVLDLGCGSGWLSIFLARHGFNVTGIDVSEHALELGQMWAAEEGHKIVWNCGDIADMHYQQGQFESVVANAIFEHLTYELAQAALSHLHTMLEPNGCFVGCFDKVWGGGGDFYELPDGTHVYTDKGRRGMMLRYFTDEELKRLFVDWELTHFETFPNGTRVVCAIAKA